MKKLSELELKLEKVGLLHTWTHRNEKTIEVTLDQYVFETAMEHVGLDAHMTLIVQISATFVMNGVEGSREIHHLCHTTHWELVFRDGSRVRVEVRPMPMIRD